MISREKSQKVCCQPGRELGHCTIRNGHDVLFTTQSLMLSQLHAFLATNNFDRQFAKLTGIGLLIIDNFGLKPMKPFQDEEFHDVISELYERKSTILTSNLDVSEWIDAFPNRIPGAATVDRPPTGPTKSFSRARAIEAKSPTYLICRMTA